MRMSPALALLALVAGSAGVAQQIGSRIGASAGAGDGREVIQIMATCYAERNPKLARRWLGTLPGSEAETAVFKGDLRRYEDCMTDNHLDLQGVEVRFKAAMFRRPVALAVVLGELRRRPEATAAAEAADGYRAKARQALATGKGDVASLAMQEFGACVAAADWPGAVAMLRTRDLNEERAAFRHLVPALGPCIPADTKVSVAREMMKQMLAEPIYHAITDAEKI